MKRYYLFIVLIIGTFVSCDNSSVEIEGRIACHLNCKIYLDIIVPGQQSVVVDSADIDEHGLFKIKVKLDDDNPVIYNLRLHKKGDIIPLILKRGDEIKINSVANVSRNYIVEGSKDSELMKEIHSLLSNGAVTLDSLGKELIAAQANANKEDEDKVLREYTEKYYDIKRKHVKFIVSNATSIAAIYALDQRLPNDATLFNGDSDILYSRTVSDTIKHIYPTSPYVKSLERRIADYDNEINLLERISDEANRTISYPEIELPDMYGVNVKLSERAGKVILIDFWSATAPKSTLFNAELKELYAKYEDKGFEVYQVSVDTEKTLWIATIQEQKLPWITVCDFKGNSSPVIGEYNVQSVPYNYLIDQEGNIVDQNIYGDKLAKKIAELIP